MSTVPANPSTYSPVRKVVHWTVLLLCALQFPTGWAIASSHLGHVGLTQSVWSVVVHRSHALAGAAVVVLLSLGIGLRLWQGEVRSSTETTRAWLRLAATVAHALIAALLLALSVTGFVAMYLSRTAASIHVFLVYFGLG